MLLIDVDGEGSRKASLRLLERIGDEAGRWSIRILEYPDQARVLAALGLVA